MAGSERRAEDRETQSGDRIELFSRVTISTGKRWPRMRTMARAPSAMRTPEPSLADRLRDRAKSGRDDPAANAQGNAIALTPPTEFPDNFGPVPICSRPVSVKMLSRQPPAAVESGDERHRENRRSPPQGLEVRLGLVLIGHGSLCRRPCGSDDQRDIFQSSIPSGLARSIFSDHDGRDGSRRPSAS